jgi:hypothetical protein
MGRASVGNERWQENWRAISPAGGTLVHVGRSRRERRALRQTVGRLPVGTPVVVSASAPGAIRRSRTFAAQSGLAVEREYLAVPSARAPAYLVEDTPTSVSVFLESVLFAPPGMPFGPAVEALLDIVRKLRAWRLVRAAAPGHMLVGRRG